VVAILVTIPFVAALNAGFVGWDDDDLLLNETHYRTLSGNSLFWMFTTSYTGHFQPLTWLSYFADFSLWSLDPFGFHLTNVLLHGGCALVFYSIARRLILLADPALQDPPWGCAGAALAALLFAVHPLRAESVAWIAERRDVLSAFFLLLSVACYLRYARELPSDLPAKSRAAWYLGVLVCCALSLLAKATAVVLPLVLLILDAYPLRRFATESSVRRPHRWIWLDKLPLLAMSIAAGLRAVAAQQQQGAMVPLAEYGILARVLQASYGLLFYLWKTLLPFELSPLYELPAEGVTWDRLGWALVGPVLLIALALASRRRFPAMASALAAYVVLLAPVLGFAQSGPQLVADRYSYLSCMGFALLLAAGAIRAVRWLTRRRWTGCRAALGLTIAVVLTFLQHATARQCDVWRSGLTLWSHALRVCPDGAIAHANYADALGDVGNLDLAMAHYRRSLALQPRDAITAHHFADVLRVRGDPDGAIGMYLRTLQLDPSRTEAHFRLAQLLVDRGRAAQAALVMRERLRLAPEDQRAAAFLADLLAAHPGALE
jgi:tetratricopeptide (TPR) repeat protein